MFSNLNDEWGDSIMSKTAEKLNTTQEFRGIPVSSQGQVTLPKAIREQLGVIRKQPAHINIFVKPDGLVVIEPEPTVEQLFGILKNGPAIKPADMYELREAMANERIRKLGYNPEE